MDLQINQQTFIVGGCTSGFGLSTCLALINEGANVIGIARNQEPLDKLSQSYPNKFYPIAGDITTPEVIEKVVDSGIQKEVSGIFVNAGGPPAKKFEETTISDWDNAYKSLLRWKVQLTQKLIPHFRSKGYGRFVYLESSSVKQPIDNLALSTSLRLSVVGMMKTLSQELAGTGINFNMIAPGSHNTPAIYRLMEKKAKSENISFEDAKTAFIENQPSKSLGKPEHLASLAVWLLSPLSEFVNGQVYAIEGGAVKGTL